MSSCASAGIAKKLSTAIVLRILDMKQVPQIRCFVIAVPEQLWNDRFLREADISPVALGESEKIILREQRRQIALPRPVIVLQHLFRPGIAARHQLAGGIE